MGRTESIDLNHALNLIQDKRRGNIHTVTELAGSYYLRRKSALKARNKILEIYAEVVRTGNSLKNPFIGQANSDLSDPGEDLSLSIDSLLHNSRGALETLSQIINFVYDLGLKSERDKKTNGKTVSFFNVKNVSKGTDALGVHGILQDIESDTWFIILTKLRNHSYHVSLNSFVPKISIGHPFPQYTIYFPIDPTKGNLNHETLNAYLSAGYQFKEARMDLPEFANFVYIRLEQYLSQLDEVIIHDCVEISENRPPLSKSDRPRLRIPYMELHSWRNIIDTRSTV